MRAMVSLPKYSPSLQLVVRQRHVASSRTSGCKHGGHPNRFHEVAKTRCLGVSTDCLIGIHWADFSATRWKWLRIGAWPPITRE